jgi:hypothetical protein
MQEFATTRPIDRPRPLITKQDKKVPAGIRVNFSWVGMAQSLHRECNKIANAEED